MELPGLTHDLLRMASVVPDVLQVHERLCVALGRVWGRVPGGPRCSP